MKRNATYNTVLTGILISFGILLSYFTSHAFGIPGTTLLPMHIPVFIIGFLCGPWFGVIGGMLTPLMSSLITGMPPMFPMLPIMMGELMTYGLISGLLYKKFKLPIYPSLIVAMLAGRIAYGMVFSVLFTMNNGALQAASVITAVTKGLPGIIVQLVILPPIISIVRRRNKHTDSIQTVDYGAILKQQRESCVVMKNGDIVYKATGRGVKPLLALIETQPSLMQDAMVIDKIIGKAAALLCIKGGVSGVYGELMSMSACEYLKKQGIKPQYGRCIDVISNRDKSGICPLEKSVMEIDDPEEGYAALKETIKELMRA